MRVTLVVPVQAAAAAKMVAIKLLFIFWIYVVKIQFGLGMRASGILDKVAHSMIPPIFYVKAYKSWMSLQLSQLGAEKVQVSALRHVQFQFTMLFTTKFMRNLDY